MRKRLNVLIFLGLITVVLSGCCIKHEYIDATCIAPKTCSKCGKTEGEITEHVWKEATCFEPKTCSVCNATEGKMLEHTWTEATCSSPKTCNACGTIEGEALAHTLTEANYQEPAKCTVCDESVGEPLQADFEKYGWECKTELDVPYEFVTNQEIADVTFSDYEVFAGDDKHEELEGYEWKAVTIDIAFRDGDAGYGMNLNDYYYIGAGDINYYGIDYPDVEIDFEKLLSDYEVNEFGNRCYRSSGRFYVRLPVGYDGIVIYLLDEESKKRSGALNEVVNENTLFFRLK